MRKSEIKRKTNETDIKLSLNLDGSGTAKVDTGIGFLDHMLTLLARHSNFDIDVKCKGDVNVDYHHSVEDVGIVLGEAFADALGDKKGIMRYGYMILPMDEALILSSVDLSGRAYLSYDMDIPTEKVGEFDTELDKEFWLGFVRASGITLHIRSIEGDNSHHIIEGGFKSVARSLRQAVAADSLNPDQIPSTKGVL